MFSFSFSSFSIKKNTAVVLFPRPTLSCGAYLSLLYLRVLAFAWYGFYTLNDSPTTVQPVTTFTVSQREHRSGGESGGLRRAPVCPPCPHPRGVLPSSLPVRLARRSGSFACGTLQERYRWRSCQVRTVFGGSGRECRVARDVEPWVGRLVCTRILGRHRPRYVAGHVISVL